MLRYLFIFAMAANFVATTSVGSEPSEDNTGDPSLNLPTIWIAGDSTAAKGSGELQRGWAEPLSGFFNLDAVNVENRARGGRSSRTFITEGHWERLLVNVKEGDLVLIQFGHNDGGAINREPPGSDRPLRARGSLPGLREESEEIDNAVTGKHELVRTFGWYMRKMIADTQAKGATPIVLSLTARNLWQDGRLERGSGMYGAWSYELAKEAKVPFVEVTHNAVDRLELLGEEGVESLYPKDYVHTNSVGAELHASVVVSGLKGLRPNPVEGWLSEKGELVEANELAWLNLPRPADNRLPTLFLVGDSTVRNGRGDGSNAQWGWGDFVGDFLNYRRMNVVNRAVGGLSSRTYYTLGHWEKVLRMLKKGDCVMVQFGHNDDIVLNDEKRARGTITGIGEETEAIDNMVTGKHEVVHTYGWYLRRFVHEAREKGATPIICTPVPFKSWSEAGTINRGLDSYTLWASQVAANEKVPLLDLRNIVADRYDALGVESVNPLFGDKRVHTSREGATLTAQCVLEGLQSMEVNPFAQHLRVSGNLQERVRFILEGENPTERGIVVTDRDRFSHESGFGYDLDSNPIKGSVSRYFSILANEGNYKVTLELSDSKKGMSGFVKSESRRLALGNLNTDKLGHLNRSFTVNVRNRNLIPPELYAPGGHEVDLKDGELKALDWDEKLTLEISDDFPPIQSISIESIECPTVYLVGDSTVADQDEEPWASWGQMLPNFFTDRVAVANHAESGEAMKSFISGLRMAKVLEGMKKGDYLFIQFAHNDQKKQWPQTYVQADTTYKTYLNVLIAEARLRGATPVLVTSMERRFFDKDGRIRSTLGAYPSAMRDVAKSQNVALIDLEPMSIALYEALGKEKSPLAFANEGRDKTHHNNYGAYQIAQCIVQGIVELELPLVEFIVEGFNGYDPSNPENVDTLNF